MKTSTALLECNVKNVENIILHPKFANYKSLSVDMELKTFHCTSAFINAFCCVLWCCGTKMEHAGKLTLDISCHPMALLIVLCPNNIPSPHTAAFPSHKTLGLLPPWLSHWWSGAQLAFYQHLEAVHWTALWRSILSLLPVLSNNSGPFLLISLSHVAISFFPSRRKMKGLFSCLCIRRFGHTTFPRVKLTPEENIINKHLNGTFFSRSKQRTSPSAAFPLSAIMVLNGLETNTAMQCIKTMLSFPLWYDATAYSILWNAKEKQVLTRWAYLLTNGTCHGDGEWPDIASAQVLPFPLITEEFEFPLLFLIQWITISNLDVKQQNFALHLKSLKHWLSLHYVLLSKKQNNGQLSRAHPFWFTQML